MFLLLLRDRFDVFWPGDEERWRGKHAHRQGGDLFVFSSTNLWQERRRQPPGQEGGEGLQAVQVQEAPASAQRVLVCVATPPTTAPRPTRMQFWTG